MSKILKNNTASIVDITDVGVSVPASGQLSINTSDFDEFSASDDVVSLIGAGTLTVNNGSEDLSKSDGIRLIQGGFSNKIQFEDSLVSANGLRLDIDDALTGPQGPAGNDGADGSDGVDGNRWLDGSGVPSNGLGNDGDYYLNNDNGDTYEKASGTWSLPIVTGKP